MFFSNVLNSREAAIVIWAVIVIGAAGLYAPTRFGNVVKSLFSQSLILIPIVDLVYLAGMVLLFYKIGLWENILYKDCFVWFFSFAIHNLSNLNNIKNIRSFNRIFLKSLTLSYFFNFILENFTFSFWIEMIIPPVVLFLVLVKDNAVKNKTPENGFSDVIKLVDILMKLIKYFILIFTLNQLIENSQSIANSTFIKSILISPILSIFFYPLLYISLIYWVLENTFIQLDSFQELNNERKILIKIYIIKYSSTSRSKNSAFFVHYFRDELSKDKNIKKLVKENLGYNI